jgi:branched-subunit amino acid ABC-type transport system permease component
VWGLRAVINDLLPFVVTGIATGSVYAIAAMGLVLTFKTSGIFNFAHGAQAALGAYLMFDLWQRHDWAWLYALAAAVLVAGVVFGVVLERMAFGLAQQPTATRVVATVGLLIGVQSLLVIRYGASALSMPKFLPASTFRLGGVNIRYEQLIVALVALVAAGLLALFFRRARLGVAMQAVVDNPALLGLQGTSPIQVRRSAWVIGSCFAAVSGALLASTTGQLETTLLTLLVVQAFGAAALGRFSSLPITYVGGLVVGVGQEVLKYALSQDVFTRNVSSQILQPLPPNLPILVLFCVMIFTPGHKLVERGAAVVRKQRPPTPLPRWVVGAGSIGGFLLLMALPELVGFRLPIYMNAMGFAVLFSSLYLLVRMSGQVSLCQVAFAAVGAASFGHISNAGAPFVVAVLLAGVVAMPVGALIAIPAIRLSGVFLAIATFGYGILIERIFFSSSLLFGSAGGVDAPRPSFARTDEGYFRVLAVVALLACLTVIVVRRGRLGRLLRGLGDAPTAITAHGGSTTVVRTISFCISAFLAGVGGAVIGPITGTAAGGGYNFGVSLALVAVLSIAGARPGISAFIAAGLYIVVPGYIDNDTVTLYTPVFFGLAAVIVATGALASITTAAARGPRVRDRLAGVAPSTHRIRPPVEVGA